MSDAHTKHEKWLKSYYEGLVGWTCTKVTFAEGEFPGQPWPQLEFRNEKMPKLVLRLEVSQDQEGNGPGFLFGLPDPR